MHSIYRRIAALASVLVVSLAALAESPGKQHNWPGFHGPKRDNKSPDTNLAGRWPAGGPKLIFKASGLGAGWAGVSIVSGRIYTCGAVNGKTVITAMDSGGKRIWNVATAAIYKGSYPNARSTPTISGGRLYHINSAGYAVCLDAKTGKRVWAVDTIKRFDGRLSRWGVSESLLVVDQRVICTPGGEKSALAALDKNTGKTLWACSGLDDQAAYTTPILVEHGGLRQVVTILANYAVGVSLETGKLLWKYPHKVPYEANCVTPLQVDGKIVLSGTWGRGASCLQLNVKGESCSVKELWRTKALDNEHGGIIELNGYIYGQADGNHKNRRMMCLELKTGKTMWSTPELAGKRTSTVSLADGMLYVMTDQGEVALVRPNPKRLEVISRFNLPKGGKGSAWAHMVICNGRLHVRHGEFLYVYDVKAGDLK
ncbi:MAG: PQQ-binding-like beta-propeller repeat protein [Phycisphaerae bacterium]|jgi:outer membrane protein assembly factor BamB|nr:PQQ-binding-like beta-propeller repeat protein [Phycisphaerae bacterium]MDP7286379.1 PQQ-binding-like beta-propeller repeat protein [Phycisphaerae bacterium]